MGGYRRTGLNDDGEYGRNQERAEDPVGIGDRSPLRQHRADDEGSQQGAYPEEQVQPVHPWAQPCWEQPREQDVAPDIEDAFQRPKDCEHEAQTDEGRAQRDQRHAHRHPRQHQCHQRVSGNAVEASTADQGTGQIPRGPRHEDGAQGAEGRADRVRQTGEGRPQ